MCYYLWSHRITEDFRDHDIRFILQSSEGSLNLKAFRRTLGVSQPQVLITWLWKCKVAKEPILHFRIKLNHMKPLILTDFKLQNWQFYLIQPSKVLHTLRKPQIFWKPNLEAYSHQEILQTISSARKSGGFCIFIALFLILRLLKLFLLKKIISLTKL